MCALHLEMLAASIKILGKLNVLGVGEAMAAEADDTDEGLYDNK